MQPIQIRPLSLLTGFGVAALAFVAMSQSPQTTSASALPGRGAQFLARPSDFVQIDEGTPYVVPPGKVFVPTAIGSRPPVVVSPTYELVSFTVNGVVELSAWKAMWSPGNELVGNGTSMRGIPSGLAVPSGATVEVRDGVASIHDARLWGYLADQ